MQIIAKKKKKGFTLIELLVVIAIIGILASIVLVSLSGAKNRAKDARITSDMNQIRSGAEIYSSTYNGNFTGLDGDSGIIALLSDIGSQCPSCYKLTTSTDTNVTSYCAVSQLNSGTAWCVDSSLRSYATGTSPSICTTAAAAVSCE